MSLAVGARVAHRQSGSGTVRFVGATQFKEGMWIGIELDQPVGKNDGTVDGVSYFSCAPLHGLFARPDKLALIEPPAIENNEEAAPSSEAPLPPPSHPAEESTAAVPAAIVPSSDSDQPRVQDHKDSTRGPPHTEADSAAFKEGSGVVDDSLRAGGPASAAGAGESGAGDGSSSVPAELPAAPVAATAESSSNTIASGHSDETASAHPSSTISPSATSADTTNATNATITAFSATPLGSLGTESREAHHFDEETHMPAASAAAAAAAAAASADSVIETGPVVAAPDSSSQPLAAPRRRSMEESASVSSSLPSSSFLHRSGSGLSSRPSMPTIGSFPPASLALGSFSASTTSLSSPCAQCETVQQQLAQQQQRARNLERQLQEEEARARDREALVQKLRAQMAAQAEQANESRAKAAAAETAAARAECDRLRSLLEGATAALASARAEAAGEVEQLHTKLQRAREEVTQAEGRAARAAAASGAEHAAVVAALNSKMEQKIEALRQDHDGALEKERNETAKLRMALQVATTDSITAKEHHLSLVRQAEFKMSETQREMEQLRAAHTQTLAALKAEAERRTTEVKAGQQSTEALEAALAARDEALAVAQRQAVDAAAQAVREKEEIQKQLHSQHQQARNALLEELRASQEEAKAAAATSLSLQDQLGGAKQALLEAEQNATTKEQEVHSLHAGHEEEKQSWLAAKVQMQSDIQALKQAVEAMRGALHEQMAARELALQTAAALQARLAEAQEQMDISEQRAARAGEEIAAMEARLAHALEQGAESTQTINSLETQLQEATSHIDVLRHHVESLEELLDTARRRLQQSLGASAAAGLLPPALGSREGSKSPSRAPSLTSRPASTYAARADGEASATPAAPAAGVASGGGATATAPLPLPASSFGRSLQITISSVMLVNSAKSPYHLYEVHVVVKEEQWRIFRRFREFSIFYDKVREVYPSLDLPFPKKTVRNKTAKVVQQRQQMLQKFLQEMVSVSMRDPRSPLHQEVTKDTLLQAFPFFGEETLTMDPVCDLDDVSEEWQQIEGDAREE